MKFEIKFQSIQQEMINRGANPHVKDYGEDSEYEFRSLGCLSNIPNVQSIYYSIKTFPNGNLPQPFNYKTGVYPGKYVRELGKGAEGVVIQGFWGREKAAFKFVQVRDQKFMDYVGDNLADMKARVREMIEMEFITGSSILKFNGHFR